MIPPIVLKESPSMALAGQALPWGSSIGVQRAVPAYDSLSKFAALHVVAVTDHVSLGARGLVVDDAGVAVGLVAGGVVAAVGAAGGLGAGCRVSLPVPAEAAASLSSAGDLMVVEVAETAGNPLAWGLVAVAAHGGSLGSGAGLVAAAAADPGCLGAGRLVVVGVAAGNSSSDLPPPAQ